MDRGYAGHAYPLLDEPAEGFLASPMAGFGEVAVTGDEPTEGRGAFIRLQPSSPAYAEIAATTSATVTVLQGGEVVGKTAWSALASGDSVEAGGSRIKLLGQERNWIKTRVVDAASKEEIPCRIHFRSSDGVPYQPHGHANHVATDIESWHLDVGGDLRLGRVSYAYVDGSCEGWLPRGKVLVDVAQGFEYNPLRSVIEIAPGQQELELELERWSDLRNDGWYSGDSHVHFLSTAGGHLEGRAEGLNVVNLLRIQAGGLFTGTEEFTGRPSVSHQGDSVVFVGQENRQHFLGHLSLLGLRHPVLPLSTGGSSEAELGGTLEATLAEWADRCHAQDGTVILPHLPVPNGEPAALIATGRVDAVEMCEHKMHFHREYYRYLNAGYRLPLVGGTDKMSAEVPVGLYRTYVRIPVEEEFSYESWCRNLRKGSTFISSGPLLTLTVEGMPIGSTLQLPAGGGTVEVEASAESIFPIHRLELIQGGRVVAAAVDKDGVRRLHLNDHLKVNGNTWLAVRVGAIDYERPLLFADAWARGVMAHSSPIYVSCGGEWTMFDGAATEYMLSLIDVSLAYIRESALRLPSGSVTHHHGGLDHQAHLEHPFLEARDALNRRLDRERP